MEGPAGYLVAMSENDKDPQQGEYSDPTASPDWTAPHASSQDPTPPVPESPQPQSAPTEHIPQGGDTQAAPQAPVPPVPPAPQYPGYDAPPVQPRGDSNPYLGSSAQPTNPYAATPPPPPADPYGLPQQPAYDPYAATGAQAQPGGYPPYQAPGQWQAPPAAYGAPPPQNTSALVLTIVSGLALVSCCNIFVIPSLVLGIMGLTKNNDDPVGARRLTKFGWIGFGIAVALVIIAVIVFIAVGAAGGFDSNSSYDSDYSY